MRVDPARVMSRVLTGERCGDRRGASPGRCAGRASPGTTARRVEGTKETLRLAALPRPPRDPPAAPGQNPER
eukprot:3444797-Prymnesium_polylepis.1